MEEESVALQQKKLCPPDLSPQKKSRPPETDSKEKLGNTGNACCPARAHRMLCGLAPARIPQTVPEESTTAMVAAEPNPSTSATRTMRKTAAAVATVSGILI
ncbi:hypothetical protein IEQ34_004922 [Dendrobium chrysotoxum]|uniref:Uncharacterized protein n=1 Tax=Dendrobium chrysotoxum TaxID=161865 RepID=A0AAV7GTM8_DENCH|nr:hypothetical protein IEQ34_004922 [Dendrobium chrysotoxum]